MLNYQQSHKCCTCAYLHNPIHDTYTPARLTQYSVIESELPHPPITIQIYKNHEAHIIQIKSVLTRFTKCDLCSSCKYFCIKCLPIYILGGKKGKSGLVPRPCKSLTRLRMSRYTEVHSASLLLATYNTQEWVRWRHPPAIHQIVPVWVTRLAFHYVRLWSFVSQRNSRHL